MSNVRPESMARITNFELANAFIEEQVKLVREQVGDKKVLLALSGGVDSSVVAALLIKAIGKQLVCVHVNHGLLRKGEPEQVVEEYEKIATLICTPPLAVKSNICNKVISTIEYNVSLKDVMEYGYKSGFSNIPIFKDGMLIGVANAGKIIPNTIRMVKITFFIGFTPSMFHGPVQPPWQYQAGCPPYQQGSNVPKTRYFLPDLSPAKRSFLKS